MTTWDTSRLSSCSLELASTLSLWAPWHRRTGYVAGCWLLCTDLAGGVEAASKHGAAQTVQVPRNLVSWTQCSAV